MRLIFHNFFLLLKKKCRFYKQVIWKYAKLVIEILKTPYKSLVFDIDLSLQKWKVAPLEIQVVSESESFNLLKLGSVSFYWPSFYDTRGLDSIYKEIFAPEQYNPHAYETKGVVIEPDDWVIDAGACEGFFTHYALSRGANVLIVEPMPPLAEALSLTFQNEIKNGQVRVLNGALGSQSGFIEITIPEGGPIAASIDPAWKINKEWDLGQASDPAILIIPVKVYCLDDILAEGIIPTVDFLKMDIENGEVAAFEGATKTLGQIKPKLAIAVYHEYLNAQKIRAQILKNQPNYKVSWRGVFFRESFGPPRPYILYANV